MKNKEPKINKTILITLSMEDFDKLALCLAQARQFDPHLSVARFAKEIIQDFIDDSGEK